MKYLQGALMRESGFVTVDTKNGKGPHYVDNFVVKDSGVREQYESGMVRDTQQGKPRYALLPLSMLTRWAEHMAKGAGKYGDNNWKHANSVGELNRFHESAFRHLIQWLSGDLEEDHAAAIMFNVAAAEHVKDVLNREATRQDL